MVYAASNKQYREAYLLYLREAVFCLDKESAATSSAAVKAAFPLTSLPRSSSNHRGEHELRCFNSGNVINKTDHIEYVASVIARNSAPCPVTIDPTASNANVFPFVSI